MAFDSDARGIWTYLQCPEYYCPLPFPRRLADGHENQEKVFMMNPGSAGSFLLFPGASITEFHFRNVTRIRAFREEMGKPHQVVH